VISQAHCSAGYDAFRWRARLPPSHIPMARREARPLSGQRAKVRRYNPPHGDAAPLAA